MAALSGTVCGLDEAGRGALAGPLVVTAVLLPKSFSFDAFRGLIVRDSKELTNQQRIRLGRVIAAVAVVRHITVSATAINRRGITWANTEGFARLIRRLDADEYIVDGRWQLPPLGERGERVHCLVRADARVPAALAAGVMAKLHRDALMRSLSERHPEYGWATNTGHGTLSHIAAIREHGVTGEHRRQFVATALNGTRRRRHSAAEVKALTTRSVQR